MQTCNCIRSKTVMHNHISKISLNKSKKVFWICATESWLCMLLLPLPPIPTPHCIGPLSHPHCSKRSRDSTELLTHLAKCAKTAAQEVADFLFLFLSCQTCRLYFIYVNITKTFICSGYALHKP